VDLQAHHKKYRSEGGPTALSNEITLCSICHKLLHLGLLELSGSAATGHTWTRHPISPGAKLRNAEELIARLRKATQELPEIEVGPMDGAVGTAPAAGGTAGGAVGSAPTAAGAADTTAEDARADTAADPATDVVGDTDVAAGPATEVVGGTDVVGDTDVAAGPATEVVGGTDVVGDTDVAAGPATEVVGGTDVAEETATVPTPGAPIPRARLAPSSVGYSRRQLLDLAEGLKRFGYSRSESEERVDEAYTALMMEAREIARREGGPIRLPTEETVLLRVFRGA
jgi:hypothetical protein